MTHYPFATAIFVGTFTLSALGDSFGPRTIADAWLGGVEPISYQVSYAGAPVSAMVSNDFASATVHTSLGQARITAESTGPGGAANLSAYSLDTHTITGGNGEGTVTFTYQLSGTLAGSTSAGSIAGYSAGTNHWGGLLWGRKDYEGDHNVFPPQTMTDTFTFTYGEPFDMEGNLTVNLSQPSANQNGSANLVLQPCGFVVSGGGSYMGTATGGSTKGTRFEANAPYAGFTLTNIRYRQSTVKLLDGTANDVRDVAVSFLGPREGLSTFSDNVHFQGTAADPVVIQLNYDEAAAIASSGSEEVMLSRLDFAAQEWKNAVTGNSSGTPSAKNGPYNPATDFVLGKFGIDRSANVVWAVVNYPGSFAATQAAGIAPTPTNYPAWKSAFFSEATAADPLVSGPNSDPDRDGLVNRLEYAFNLSPIVAGLSVLTPGSGTAGLPSITAVGADPLWQLRVEYIRRKASSVPGIHYTPQSSSSLAESGAENWAAIMGTETVTSIDAVWERVVVVDTATAVKRRFARLKVGEP